ncbi:metallophosphoesterase family protein [Sulfitobacter dubius]|uniref:metallophosphoesterase family protein n=1 Tax=Sulfitobacter dubius TaxID=218673 RepID=UPI0008E3756F|nr:metallophosphoesterase family protein [Sulfitobacter dubius]SFG43851.1 Calcineurin-like phosphoesterase superfamily domain-containing protein [Sulfitobacter dubius]
MQAKINWADLQVLDGPLLLFGGPYSNLQAVEALADFAAARGIGGDQMICTGDMVAYCGAPSGSVAAIRALGSAVVAGNCELQLASGAEDCGCGFAPGSSCDMLSGAWYAHAAQALAAEAKTWMGSLPDVAVFQHHGQRYGVIHGGVRDVARFIWSESAEAVFEEEWQALEEVVGPVDHIIAGHSGLPFIHETPRGRWINAGVIGMPPHDGAQQTRVAVLDGGEVTFHRLSYDVAGAVADMAKAGLPRAYADALQSGYWPSEDVLPPGLRVPSLARG